MKHINRFKTLAEFYKAPLTKNSISYIEEIGQTCYGDNKYCFDIVDDSKPYEYQYFLCAGNIHSTELADSVPDSSDINQKYIVIPIIESYSQNIDNNDSTYGAYGAQHIETVADSNLITATSDDGIVTFHENTVGNEVGYIWNLLIPLNDEQVYAYEHHDIEGLSDLFKIYTVNIVFKKGTKKIHPYTFNTNDFLYKITIPNFIAELEPYAIHACNAASVIFEERSTPVYLHMYAINIPNSVAYRSDTEILLPDTAILNSHCLSIRNTVEVLRFPKGIEYIPDNLPLSNVKNCLNLENVKYIDNYSLQGKYNTAFNDFSKIKVLGSSSLYSVKNDIINLKNLEVVQGYSALMSAQANEIYIEGPITSIPTYTLEYAIAKKVTFGKNIKTIGSYVLIYGSASQVIFKSQIPPTVPSNALYNIGEIYVPLNALDAYKTSTSFTRFANIIKPIELMESDSTTAVIESVSSVNETKLFNDPNTTVHPVEVTIDDYDVSLIRNTMVLPKIGSIYIDYKISGNSIFQNWFSSDVPIKKVYVGSNIEYIYSNAFYNNKNLESLEFKNNSKLIHISANAFAGCANLTNVKLPSTTKELLWACFNSSGLPEDFEVPSEIESIQTFVFNGTPFYDSLREGFTFFGTKGAYVLKAEKMSEVIFPKEVTEVFVYQFSKSHTTNTALTKVGFEEGSTVKAIPTYFCNEATNLVEFDIPDTVETIGEYAFYKTGIKSMVLPNGIKFIGSYAFGESKLEKITFPDIIRPEFTDISQQAFYRTNIESIDIPEGITYLGYKAIAGCKKLKYIILPSTITYIYGEWCFAGNSEMDYVYIKATTPPALVYASNVFSESKSDKLIVPLGSLEAYRNSVFAEYTNNIVPDIKDAVYSNLRPVSSVTVGCRRTAAKVPCLVDVTGVNIVTEEPASDTIQIIAESSSFDINTSDSDITRNVTLTYGGLSCNATVIQKAWTEVSYEVSGEWVVDAANSNDEYDAYKSTNHTDNSVNYMYIDIDGYDSFEIEVRLSSEGSYDPLAISDVYNPDEWSPSEWNIENNGYWVDSSAPHLKELLVTVSNNYKTISLNGDGRICIVYIKDYTVSEGDDCGYIRIRKNQ